MNESLDEDDNNFTFSDKNVRKNFIKKVYLILCS